MNCLRAVFPGTLERKTPAGFARHAERADAGAAQIGIQRADRMIRDHVQRAGHRKRRDRRAARQRFELHDAEGVGEAREHEDVGRRQMRGQIRALLFAEKSGLRIAALQLGRLRSVADHDLGSRQVQREKRLEVLFDRDAAHGHEDRPRQIELGRHRRAVNRSVSTPRVQKPSFLKPRAPSSCRSEAVATMVMAAAA